MDKLLFRGCVASLVAGFAVACDSGRAHHSSAEVPYDLPANAYGIDLPGCNSVSWEQVPGNPNLFVGRQTVAGPGACDESQGYKLIVASMDWSTHRLTVVDPDLFVVPKTIYGGYTITSAYDATLLWAHDELWVAFE